MRVGISLLTLVPGISGGSETYARALTRTLAAEGTLDYRVFLPTIAADAGGGLDAEVVTRYRASRGMPGRIAAMASAALRPGPLRRALDVDRLAALHFPLSVMLPPVSRVPAVTTVLDVQHEVFPEFFSHAELAYRRRVYGWTVRRSQLVVTISEHAKQALVERLGLPPDKVRVIYLAVDHERFRPGGEEREQFLLYPANPWPHKNHARLLEAFRLVRAQHPELRLVLTGHGHEEPVPEGVEIAGRVPLDELVSLYRRAACVVFPSLYEGFGQPPLEALACGTPVACSDIPPLREVCGEAAAYFDPTQPEAIAAGIEEALRRAPELSAAGPARAARFTWSENARLHEAVYRKRRVRIPPHWRKAPLTLLHHRPVLAAVAFGAFLVALSSASSPFFTAATGSAALRDKLREMGPYAAGLDIETSYVGSFRQFAAPPGLHTAAFERQARRLTHGIPLTGKPVVTTIVGAVPLSRAGDDSTSESVRLTARTRFLDKVIRLQGDPHAPGVWLANTTAQTLHVRPGDRVEFPLADPHGTLHRTTLPVAGIYEALWKKPERPDWINFTRYIYPFTGFVHADPVLPPVFAFMSQDALDRIMKKADVGGTDQFFEVPFTAKRPLLSDARHVADRFAAIHKTLTPTFTRRPSAAERASRLYYGAVIGAKDTTSLPQAIGLADKTIAGVATPTRLLAEAGALIALVVVGASGAFLVARRRAEARTLFARGEAVPSFAGRTVVEAVLPSIGGGALGVAAALALIRAVEPNGSLDVSTLRAGALAATLGVAAGLLLVGASAGIAYARLYEVGARTHPLLRRTPWELVALAAGIVLLVRLRHGGGLSHDKATGIAHPSLLSFLVPVLLVGGVAAFLARIGGKPLRLAADRAWAAPLPVLLSLRRLAAGRGVLSLLVVTSAIALGLLLYAQTLVSSLEDSVRQKAYIAAGSDAQGIVEAEQAAPRNFPFPVTRTEIAYGGGRLGNAEGDSADVIGIDPKTLPAAVHWVSSWGPPPEQLVAHLDDPGRPVHVLATGPPTTLRSVNVGGTQIPVDVTWIHAFPGMTAQSRLVVFSQRRLYQAAGGFDPLDPPWAYLWAKGPTKPLVAALRARPANAFITTTAEGFRTDPNVALALRTFSFMRALGIAAGTLALFCLVLYLLARQRAQTIATAFGRRMGLRRLTAAAALALELGLILAVALAAALAGALVAAGSIVPRSDPLPQLAPGPVFAGPWLGLAVILATLAVLTVLAGLVASRPPRDEALVEAIRLE